MTFDKSIVVVAVNIRGSKCGVTAGHHHGVVPDDEDPQPLTQVENLDLLLVENTKIANDENLGADSVAQVQNPINLKIESFMATPPEALD